jgi:hypothetical protein
MRAWSEHIANISGKIADNVKAAQEAEKEDKSEDEVEVPFNEADLTDIQFDTYIKLCAFGLEDELKGDKTQKQFVEYLENTLDEPTIYKILEVTGGLKLGEQLPNQIPTGTVN